MKTKILPVLSLALLLVGGTAFGMYRSGLSADAQSQDGTSSTTPPKVHYSVNVRGDDDEDVKTDEEDDSDADDLSGDQEEKDGQTNSQVQENVQKQHDGGEQETHD